MRRPVHGDLRRPEFSHRSESRSRTCPQSVVAQAAALVAAAGITDPGDRRGRRARLYRDRRSELHQLRPQNINQQVTDTVAPNSDAEPAPTAGNRRRGEPDEGDRGGERRDGGHVHRLSDRAPSRPTRQSITRSLHPSAGYLGASAFGGTLPSGSVTIAAGQTTAQFTIDVPQGALGATPEREPAGAGQLARQRRADLRADGADRDRQQSARARQSRGAGARLSRQ